MPEAERSRVVLLRACFEASLARVGMAKDGTDVCVLDALTKTIG